MSDQPEHGSNPNGGDDRRREPGTNGDAAYCFEQVRDLELEAIREGRESRTGRRQEPLQGSDAVARAHSARLAGLAVSGGGIRSATFNLGVIQALARMGLLSRLDYVSVASGGGFIGSWLTSWIRRHGVRQVEAALANAACADEPPEEESDGEAEDGSSDRDGGGPGGDPAAADAASAAAEEQAVGAAAGAVAEETGSEPATAGRGAFDARGSADPGQEVEAAPIRWLRQFSNYLTPKVGLFSGDFWAIFETYLRNLLLNFGLVIGLLALIMLSPRLLLLLSRIFHAADPRLLIGLSLGFLAIALAFIGINLGQFFPERTGPWPAYTRQGWVQILVVLPLFASAWFGAHWLWKTEAGALAEVTDLAVADADGQTDLLLGKVIGDRIGWYQEMGLAGTEFEVVTWILFGAVVYALCWLLGALIYFVSAQIRHQREPSWSRRWWRALLFSAPIAGAVGGALCYTLTLLTGKVEGALKTEYVNPHWHLLHLNVWVVPGLIGVFLLTAFLHTGLMGRAFAEPLRQWYSRLGGWLMIYSLTWVGFTGLALYGPIVIVAVGQWAFTAATAGWAGATGVGVAVGRKTAEGTNREKVPGRVRQLVISLAPQIFIVGLLALVALGVHLILSPGTVATAATAGAGDAASGEVAYDAAPAAPARDTRRPLERAMAADPLDSGCDFFWPPEDPETGRKDIGRVLRCHSQRVWNGTTGPRTLTLLGLLLVATVLLSWRVDINEFSMHLLYRNRLIRAYLGASNDKRRQHPFTGFDPDDDLPLAKLSPAEGYDGPFPIHNTTLNLVAGQELAWQERKGASFAFTPLTSGFEVYHGRSTKTLVEHGYRPTRGYQQTEDGISLGTAVGISGAAASPNMGAASNPTMAFLLTVFNVRLGWWLGNPRHRATWSRMGPRVGLLSLLNELFGQTDETSRFVYLSDGGHFENLGIYELVRRRCHFIVASDAGADPDFTFQDLGNAVRKCCIDFGVDIDIDTERVLHDPETDRSVWHCAVGSIRYDKIDPQAAPGVLLYIKASLTGDESRDVLTYDVDNPTFPHESTADQWFSESQFESYRKLGQHVALSVFRRADDRIGSLAQEVMLVRLQEAWYPPSDAPEGAFSSHAREIDELFDRLRNDPKLHFLAGQFYPEWSALSASAHIPEAERPERQRWLPAKHDQLVAGFFFCHSVLQLMESVYLDLDLETEYDHPDNRGWVNLFKHWAWAGMLIATWTVTSSTFGARFQHFCRRRLGLTTGALKVEEHRLTAGAVAATAERLESESKLNFLEAELVRDFDRVNPGLADRLLVIRIAVPEPAAVGSSGGSALVFTCGIALTAGDALLYLRIQDHLRRQGLGRRALWKLVRDHGVERLHPMTLEGMPEWSRPRHGEHELDLVRILFRSVINLESNGASAAPTDAHGEQG